MDNKRTSDEVINQIYDDLLKRVLHISYVRVASHINISEKYDLTQSGTPRVGETEYAFYMWNCAILTAFRKVEGMTEEENFKWNIERNKSLKGDLLDNGLMFRSVSGMYREAHWEKPVEEICFFVTNTDSSGEERGSDNQLKDFFRKVYLLAEKYEQDCFLFTFPGANRVAFLIATNNNARKQFRGDTRFAGPLFTNVENIGDWTQCSDGRISFRLKGMILKRGTGNKRLRIGEGNLFDTSSYKADGLIVIRESKQEDLEQLCKEYDGDVPLVVGVLQQSHPTASDVQQEVIKALNALMDMKCRHIGFHCSASVEGSYIKGAKIALDTVKEWTDINSKSVKEIDLVDIYGEYERVLALEQKSRTSVD